MINYNINIKFPELDGTLSEINESNEMQSIQYLSTNQILQIIAQSFINKLNENPESISISGLSRVAFTGDYYDLANHLIPPPDDMIENNANAYETDINNTDNRILKSLKPIAFTGEYEDLFNKPTNLYNFLDLPRFLNSEINEQNSQKFFNLCTESNYIFELEKFKDENNLLLKDAIKNMMISYYNDLKAFGFHSGAGIKIFILNVKEKDNNILDPSLIQLDFITLNQTNFNNNDNNIDTDSAAIEQLNNISISLRSGSLFFDYKNNIIYCKLI